MKIKSLQHAINRMAFLERQLSERPPIAVYSGESSAAADAVECENRQNDERAEYLEAEIKKCEAYIKKH